MDKIKQKIEMEIIDELILNDIDKIVNTINKFEIEDKIKIINNIKLKLHECSPFKNEPVDCILWVNNKLVKANDYNPNKVAPPEMELLKVSILADGYTQPIVAYKENDKFVVVDGFHRNRVGREIEEITKKVNGYLPISIIRTTQEDKGDRIASTIRHNRARGKHQVQGMSNIVLELKRRNWSDNKIAKNLGMDKDEILRLTQIGGLRDMFKNEEFSLAWEVSDNTNELDIDEEEIQK